MTTEKTLKYLNCKKCNKKTEVGSKCTSVLCENCTEKEYRSWVNSKNKEKENEKKKI